MTNFAGEKKLVNIDCSRYFLLDFIYTHINKLSQTF